MTVEIKLVNIKKYVFQGFSMVNLPIVTSKYNCNLKFEDAIKHYQYGRIHKMNMVSNVRNVNKNIMTKTKIISFPKY